MKTLYLDEDYKDISNKVTKYRIFLYSFLSIILIATPLILILTNPKNQLLMISLLIVINGVSLTTVLTSIFFIGHQKAYKKHYEKIMNSESQVFEGTVTRIPNYTTAITKELSIFEIEVDCGEVTKILKILVDFAPEVEFEIDHIYEFNSRQNYIYSYEHKGVNKNDD